MAPRLSPLTLQMEKNKSWIHDPGYSWPSHKALSTFGNA